MTNFRAGIAPGEADVRTTKKMKFRFFNQSALQAGFIIFTVMGLLFFVLIPMQTGHDFSVNGKMVHPGDPDYNRAATTWTIGMAGGGIMSVALAIFCFRFGFNNERYIRLSQRFHRNEYD
jgi:hypothetical protein